MTTTPNNATQQKLSEIISDLKDVKGTASNIERQMAVHEQRHVALDGEHNAMAGLLNDHGKRIAMVESTSQQNRRDIERLTALVERLVWAFAAPLITGIVGALIWALSQVSR